MIDIKVEPPGPNARDVVSTIDTLCARSTFTYPLVIHDGEGCYIKDVDGNTYLDFTSNICSTPLGYSHPAVVGVLREYSSNGAHKIAGQDFYSREHADLAERLLRIAPNGFKAFFINSGAEAVENAIKLAYRYTGKSIGLSCVGAFHGRTLGALTFTYSKPVQKKNYPELPVKRIRFNSIEELEEAEKSISDIAFIITEVIQGESGYNIASRSFIERLYRMSKKHQIPLIIDEVQSGMARTGRWWAFQHYGIEPDIMSVAKGLQVGATLYRKIFDPEAGAISSTWGGGHRIDMAVGAAIIDAIEKEHLLDNAIEMGNILLKRLDELRRYDAIIDVRGIGLMIGIEFNTSKVRDYIIRGSFKNGLLLLPGGSKAIRIAPPLIISENEIDEGLGVLEKVLKSSILSS